MTREPPAAFDPEILLAHGDFLRALASGLVADPLQADDVVQDTWLAAISKPPRAGPHAGHGLRAWLAVVARNFANQSGRRESRARDREAQTARAERVASTAEIVEREAVRRAVVEALTGLDEPYRSTLVLRFYEGLAPRQIAARLALPVETVRTRIKRGLEQLRRRLAVQQGGESSLWGAALLALAAAPQEPGASAVLSAKKLAAPAVVGVLGVVGVATWLTLRPTEPARATPTEPALAAVEPAASSLEPERDLEIPTRAALPPAQSAPRAEPAADRPLRFQLEPRTRQIVGVVVDERDAPIAGALVFAGNAIRARGDEPFKPFRPERIQDGVLTDAAGQFALAGRARDVTAWHARYGSVTVRWEDARQILLRDKAPLNGRLVDRAGRPVGRAKIVLDRERETTTDSEGQFAFDEVERGLRGLQVEQEPEVTQPDGLRRRRQGRWFGVRFEDASAGTAESTGSPALIDLVLDAGKVELALESGGKPFEEPIACFPIGLERVFAMPAKEARTERGTVAFEGLMDGAHLLLAQSGEVARFEISGTGKARRIDLGERALVARAPAGTRLYLVPAPADEFVQLMAGRLAAQKVPDSGEVRWEPLAAGRWALGIDSLGIVAEVDVRKEAVTVVLE